MSMHARDFSLVPPPQGAEHSPLGPSCKRYRLSEPTTCNTRAFYLRSSVGLLPPP